MNSVRNDKARVLVEVAKAIGEADAGLAGRLNYEGRKNLRNAYDAAVEDITEHLMLYAYTLEFPDRGLPSIIRSPTADEVRQASRRQRNWVACRWMDGLMDGPEMMPIEFPEEEWKQ